MAKAGRDCAYKWGPASRAFVLSGSCLLEQTEAAKWGTGNRVSGGGWRRRRGQQDVVEFERIFRRCSRIPSSRGKGWTGCEVAGALQGEADGLRTGEAVLLQSSSEGAEMDLVEQAEPRQEVLCLRGCPGELRFLVILVCTLHPLLSF